MQDKSIPIKTKLINIPKLLSYIVLGFALAYAITIDLYASIAIVELAAWFVAMPEITGINKWINRAIRYIPSTLLFFAYIYFTDVNVILFAIGWIVCGIACYSLKKATKARHWILGILAPLYLLFYSEFMQGRLTYVFRAVTMINNNPDAYRTFHYVFLFVYGFLFLFTILFSMFGKKRRVSYIISGFICCVLSLINFVVLSLTEQPLVPSDIFNLKTAANVIGTQTLSSAQLTTLLVGIGLMVLYFVIVVILTRREVQMRAFSKYGLAIIGFVGVAFILMVGNVAANKMIQFKGNYKYGFFANFIMNLDYGIKFPENVDNYLLEEYDHKENQQGSAAEIIETKPTPNVIIIMNEAFSDMKTSLGVECDADASPFFHALQEKFPNGTSYSSVYANNTVSSEWEVLSGIPTALTVKGVSVYQQNCKKMDTLVSCMNERGYFTFGLHPELSDGYNRKDMYKELGFDLSIFKEDIELEEQDLIRNYVSDLKNYQTLISVFEEHNDDPFFCMNVTMQNHGGYMQDNPFEEKIQITNCDKEFPDMELYLSGIRESDKALEYLISYFEQVNEPTVILFFGDHQPVGAKELYYNVNGLTKDDNELITEIYAIPYLIWANYDLNEATAPKETSINYLHSILFNVANIEPTIWMEKIDYYRTDYPVLTANFYKDKKGDTFLSSTLAQNVLNVEKTDPLYPLKEYALYSYGILAGKTA